MKRIPKVIFDTNILRNTEPQTFLGGRSDLKKFAEIAEIIFPDIVIEELKSQKRKSLAKSKSSFLSNPFHRLRNLNEQETLDFDNEAHINQLEINEDIEYSVIKLNDYTILEKIKNLAINKLPPFESSDGTDKGFKDAYIYFTILEYLQDLEDKYIFVCTKDSRLKEALEKHQNIKVVSDFEEFKGYNSVASFSDEYFIEKLKNEFGIVISEENIIDFWTNINGNEVVLIELNDDKLVIEVDSGEIIGSKNTADYESLVTEFISSGNFESTHRLVKQLRNYKNYLSDNEIIDILEASISNSQIAWIMEDTDVKQFISDLFEGKKDVLEQDLVDLLEKTFTPSKTLDENLPPF